jgi:hypothetical protein
MRNTDSYVVPRKKVPLRDLVNKEIAARAYGMGIGEVILLVVARHPQHPNDREKEIRMYMLEQDTDFYIWVFDVAGTAVWDTTDEERFDELLNEYEIPECVCAA